MSGSGKPESDVKVPAWGERGGSQTILLLVLLLVVAVFGYVYFFTGLIMPREEQAPPQVAETQVVKKPLPARTEKAQTGKETGSAQQKQKEAPAPTAAKAPAPTNTEPPKAQPAQPPKQEAAKVQTPQPPKKEVAKPATAPDKGAAPSAQAKAKPKETKAAQKPPVAVAQGAAKKVAAPAKPAGAYTLAIGDFVLDRDLKKTEAKLKKAGIATFSVTKDKKTEPMHRVHVADFTSRQEAEAELKKLLKVSSAAFILPLNGKQSLYAGSYFQEAQAVREKDRVALKLGKDAAVAVQKADVRIPVRKLSAGRFSSNEKAQAEADRLRALGITATVAKVKK